MEEKICKMKVDLKIYFANVFFAESDFGFFGYGCGAFLLFI